jgi:rubrerythrin
MEISQSTPVKINIKIKVMSDSVKKYHELVEEGIINPDTKIKDPKKAFRILVEYDIEDIKEAVRIYEKNLK